MSDHATRRNSFSLSDPVQQEKKTGKKRREKTWNRHGLCEGAHGADLVIGSHIATNHCVALARWTRRQG